MTREHDPRLRSFGRPMPALRTILACTLPCVIAVACLPPATIPESEPAAPPPAVFAEREVAEGAPERLATGIARGECPAAISELPLSHFEGRVLIRPPAGVTEDNFVEYAPHFARNTQAIESSNCHEGMPGPLINYMLLTVLAEQPGPSRTLEDIRDELLFEAMGYPAGSVLVEQAHPDSQTALWVYEVPADHAAYKEEPAKLLLMMTVRPGETVALAFEVHPDAWSVIVDSLVASALGVTVLGSP